MQWHPNTLQRSRFHNCLDVRPLAVFFKKFTKGDLAISRARSSSSKSYGFLRVSLLKGTAQKLGS